MPPNEDKTGVPNVALYSSINGIFAIKKKLLNVQNRKGLELKH